MMNEPITIVIADDHPLMRKGLRQVLEADAGIAVLHDAEDGEDALQAIRRHKPAIAILDIEMPKLDGFGVAKKIIAEEISTSIIFLTMFREEMVFNKAMDLGIKGYVLKENAVTEILRCVHQVAERKHFISSSISDLLIRRSNRNSLPVDDIFSKLTSSELTVLKLISQMKTSQQIADHLFISIKTVNNHRTNIAAKLGVSGTHALLKFAVEYKSRL